MAEGYIPNVSDIANIDLINVRENLRSYRIILSANQSVELHENSTQRHAIIILTDSTGSSVPVIRCLDRWGNLHPVVGTDSLATVTSTGSVNTLGVITITNITNSYIQLIIYYPINMYSNIKLIT